MTRACASVAQSAVPVGAGEAGNGEAGKEGRAGGGAEGDRREPSAPRAKSPSTGAMFSGMFASHSSALIASVGRELVSSL